MSEYGCKCGCGYDKIDPLVDEVVQLVRSKIPGVQVNSGCRCEAHNRSVKGKPDSAHLRGLAVDLSCQTSRDRFYMIALLFSKKIRRIGVAHSFIHFDVDLNKPQNVIFFY